MNIFNKLLFSISIFSSLEKNQLIDLIFSNQEALDALIIEDKKQSLMKMTNQEIKNLLKGVEGISRLKKAELIKIALKKEQKQVSKNLRRES